MFNCQRKHTITCFITECRESSYQTFDFIRDRAERTDSVMTCLLGLNRENIFIRSGGINKNPSNGHKVIKFHNKVLQCFNITVKLWSAVPSEKTKIVLFFYYLKYIPPHYVEALDLVYQTPGNTHHETPGSTPTHLG